MNTLTNISGLKIIVPPPIEVSTKRSWKERLFTRPWRPLVTHNISFMETIQGDKVIKIQDSLLMNQATYEQLKARLDKDAREEYRGGVGWNNSYLS